MHIYFSVLIIFVLWLHYEMRKTSRLSRKGTDEFWKQEREANQIRRVDITDLDYITIPLHSLPMSDHIDSTINSYRDTILNLADKKILNLTGLSNTDLKLKYGAPNIGKLSEYDNNYTVLVSILQKWGERLYTLGYATEALSVLEFAVMCLTDAKKTYRLLSKLYMEQNTPEKIDPLLDILPYTKVTRKEQLIEELTRFKNS